MKLRISVEVEREVQTIKEAAEMGGDLKTQLGVFGTINKWSEKVINR